MEEVLDIIKRDRVKFVNLQFSDMNGKAKSVTIPVSKLNDALKYGHWFDGSSIEGFARISESDMLLKPDTSTYAVIPWLSENGGRTARFICDVYTPEEEPYECDPRYILRKALKEAEELGFVYKTGPELEFFLLKNGDGFKPHDDGNYFDLVMDMGFDVRREMMEALTEMGIDIETSHHEVAPGQHEITFRYGNALTTADRVMTLKSTLKAVAAKHNLYATFMPKPIYGVNGSGMHVHQSLFTKEGENAFYNPGDKYKFSDVAYQFLAGQMKHIKALTPILNPLVNSYKRLVPGYEASTYICWATINRSALIRVPKYIKGKEKSIRMEIRCPDPSANPYLAFAVLLKAGLDGIKNKMTPPEPVEENVFHYTDRDLAEKKIDTLPHSLYDAMNFMKSNDTITSFLGENFVHKYLMAKNEEWDDFRTHVTDWEINKYLNTI